MDLPTLVASILPQARFTTPGTGGMDLGLQAYRQQYRASQTANGIQRGYPQFYFLHAGVEVSSAAAPLFKQLTETMRNMLESHVDPQTSRIAFSSNLPVGWTHPEPNVDLFSRQVLRCAALVGPSRAIKLLENCIRGDRIPCTHVTILEGIQIENQCLEMCGGIRFEQLSKDRRALVKILPEMLARKLLQDPLAMLTDRSLQLPGATALYMESTAALSISSPSAGRRSQSFDQSLVPDTLLLQALSLACNSYIAPAWEWFIIDHGLAALTGCNVTFANDATLNRQHHENAHSHAATLAQSDVDFARILHDKLTAQSLDARSQIAFERWHNSKAHKLDMVNDAIDMRIALEALFAGGGNTELAHRIALRGAWYLGEDADDRRRHFEMLKRVYILCSKAVHTGRLKGDGACIDLLDQARNVCRNALIRHIREGVRPDEEYWNALVLGRAEMTFSLTSHSTR